MRIPYAPGVEILIIKLTAGVPHGLASSVFVYVLGQSHFQRTPPHFSLRCWDDPIWSSNSRLKEADRASHPRTRNREADWPSLVIEVGVSESLSQLHTRVEEKRASSSSSQSRRPRDW